MRGVRPLRVAELIHEELSRLLREEVKDPRVGQVSILEVQVSGDLRQAKVWVTPLGGGDDRQMLHGLEQAKGFLRSRIGRNLKLRVAPELDFRADRHLDRAVRMTALLERMEAERKAREGGPPPADAE